MFKRALIAAAVAAAVSAPAFADVTVSGEVDAYIDYRSQDGKSATTFENETTIFFSGEHKLDSGLQAIWLYGLTNSDEKGAEGVALRTHQSWVGLKGDFGQVRFGKMLTPAFQMMDWYMTHSGAVYGENHFGFGGSGVVNTNDAHQGHVWGGTSEGEDGRRTPNQIRYDGSFGPVALNAGVILNEVGMANDKAGSMGFSAAAIVDFSPVKLYGAFESNKDRIFSNGNEGGYEFYSVGASADVAGINLLASYRSNDYNLDKLAGVSVNKKASQDAWLVTASKSFGNLGVSAFYSHFDEIDGDKTVANAWTYGQKGSYQEYGGRVTYALGKNVTWRNRVIVRDDEGAKNDVRFRTNLLVGF
ncbi:porin [Chitinibacter tainanensis]|uniref:porin n=1 Tax=Chitinibacter tainanensis TaxID=230667 RepID=UPI0004208427|nr:porin [Chitinibacter tainanensis]